MIDFEKARELVPVHPDEGLDQKDVENFSLMRAIRAQIDPRFRVHSGHEQQVSEFLAMTRDTDLEAGIAVPVGYFNRAANDKSHRRDLTVGSEGADLVADEVAASIIGTLQASPVVRRAGATVLPGLRGDVSLPRATGNPPANWLSEQGTNTESDPTFDQVTLTPQRVGGCVEISRKLLLQSSPQIENFIRQAMLRQIMIAIDLAAINGSGTNNQPEGILQTSGIGAYSATTGADAASWEMVVGLWEACASDNVDPDTLSWLLPPAAVSKFMTTLKDTGSGKFVMESTRDGLLGRPTFVSNQVPSDLQSAGNRAAVIVGNFSDLLIGLWDSPFILVDPYTNSKTGTVRIVVEQYVDIAIAHAESFAATQDLIVT